jgi:hypothetical protein
MLKWLSRGQRVWQFLVRPSAAEEESHEQAGYHAAMNALMLLMFVACIPVAAMTLAIAGAPGGILTAFSTASAGANRRLSQVAMGQARWSRLAWAFRARA